MSEVQPTLEKIKELLGEDRMMDLNTQMSAFQKFVQGFAMLTMPGPQFTVGALVYTAYEILEPMLQGTGTTPGQFLINYISGVEEQRAKRAQEAAQGDA